MNSTKVCPSCHRDQAKDQFISKRSKYKETNSCLRCRETASKYNLSNSRNIFRNYTVEKYAVKLALDRPRETRPKLQKIRQCHTRNPQVAAQQTHVPPKPRRLLPKPIAGHADSGCVLGRLEQRGGESSALRGACRLDTLIIKQ